jgi:integrase
LRRNQNPDRRIRELEAELARVRRENEAQLTHFTAELETVRRQATARRGPATIFTGHLTQTEVNNKIRKRELGVFSDGGNLCLCINRGAKPDSDVIASWLFRWTETLRPGVYKTRSIGLGMSARMMALEDARAKAQQFRQLLAEGKDPKIERLNMLCDEQSAKNLVRTLEEIAEEYTKAKLSKRSPGHMLRVRQLLRDNVLNKEHKLAVTGMTIKVGTMPIQRVTRQIILQDCGFEQFWNEHNPGAEILKGVLDKMFNYAREKGYYVGNSPMAWRGGLEHVLLAQKDVHKVKHHSSKAVTYQTAPTFLQQHLRKHHYRRAWPIGTGPDGRPVNCYMIELALLTGTRVSEIISATWDQIDYDTMTWTVPGEKTKRKEPDYPHRMPITHSPAAIFELMQQMRTDPSPQAPIFPSHHKRWVESHRRVGSQTLMRVMRQIGSELGKNFVNHGFRTTLKDWCKAGGCKVPGFNMTWYEEQVHHKEKGKVQQAYGHDDLLEQRRGMMTEWDNYLNTVPPPAKAKTSNLIKLAERRNA